MSTETNPADYDTFYQSTAGFIIPTVTGAISCVSSLTIIFIILRSRRNTAYHRIMLLVSLSDVLSSTAIALTTIPMPADVIYSYAGPSYGTVATCDAQALMFAIGTTSSVSAICVLNIVYYLCKIVFSMEERTFSKTVEPLCFILSFPVGVIFPFILRSNGVFNPTPYESYCSMSLYPYRCNDSDAVDCIRGDLNDQVTTSLARAFLVVSLGIMGLSMLTIICKVYHDEKRMVQQRQICRPPTKPTNERNDLAIPTQDKGEIFADDDKNKAPPKSPTAEEDAILHLQHGLTKTVSLQAAMYLSAFILSFSFTFLTIIQNKSGEFPYAELKVVQVLKVVFQPSQGLFNMLIFIYHKLYQVKRVEKDLYSTCDALRLVFGNPGEIPEKVISGILQVQLNEVEKTNDANIMAFGNEEDGSDSSPRCESGLELTSIGRTNVQSSGPSERNKKQRQRGAQLDEVESGIDSDDLSYQEDSRFTGGLSGFSELSGLSRF
jgi:hypothetical protein